MNEIQNALIEKCMEISDKTNSLLKLINQYPLIVENFNLHYTNQVIYRTYELDDFKEEMNRQRKQNKLMKNIKYFDNLSTKIRNNMKEYKNLK